MFEPWEGPAYRQADNIFGGRRLLVLGESHYTNKPEEVGSSWPDYTQWCVRRFPINGESNPFYDNVARILIDVSQQTEFAQHRRRVWNSIAYFNFVPVCIDGRSRSEGGNGRRPTKGMFQQGSKSFLPVIRNLDPEAIIVCGLETWDWVAHELDGFLGKPRDVIYYDDGRYLFSRIHHPSYQKFKPEYWVDRIEYLIERSQMPRQRGAKVVWPDLRFR